MTQTLRSFCDVYVHDLKVQQQAIMNVLLPWNDFAAKLNSSCVLEPISRSSALRSTGSDEAVMHATCAQMKLRREQTIVLKHDDFAGPTDDNGMRASHQTWLLQGNGGRGD